MTEIREQAKEVLGDSGIRQNKSARSFSGLIGGALDLSKALFNL